MCSWFYESRQRGEWGGVPAPGEGLLGRSIKSAGQRGIWGGDQGIWSGIIAQINGC